MTSEVSKYANDIVQ